MKAKLTEYGWETILDGKTTNILSDDPRKAIEVTKELTGLIRYARKRNKEEHNNYGYAFYECGYDGNAQNEFIDYYRKRGVHVF